MATHGQNVWYELMTDDAKAAKGFYSEVIGWKTQDWEGGDPDRPYSMWIVGERPVGGLMVLPEEAKEVGAPPHWLAYTNVDDVDATANRTEKLGGRTLQPGFDIPEVGRIAILSDPQGAVFAVLKPAGEMHGGDQDKAGEFSWAELNTTDYEGAWSFYSALFGWEHRSSMDMGSAGTYFMFHDPGQVTKGGMSNAAQQMGAPPHWLYYVNVADVATAAECVERLGGAVLNGPMEIPGGDTIAQCRDPQGALFAIYSEGENA